jgi:hypothetical protein
MKFQLSHLLKNLPRQLFLTDGESLRFPESSPKRRKPYNSGLETIQLGRYPNHPSQLRYIDRTTEGVEIPEQL